jgi:hypothetical protein
MVENNSASELMEGFFEIESLDTDQFLKVKETLTRIGIASRKKGEEKPTLWQSCHILHKRGRYFVCHFKQLFLLDGRTKVTNFDDEDYDRTEYIVALLEEWGLIKSLYDIVKPKVNVVVIPYSKKNDWNLRSKYTIGEKNVQ